MASSFDLFEEFILLEGTKRGLLNRTNAQFFYSTVQQKLVYVFYITPTEKVVYPRA